MTTPTGQISLNNVNVELGLAGTTTISMNQTNVRTLAGVPSGQISMQNLQGKSNRVSISYTFSSNTANASLNLSAIGGYSAGKSDITVTINTGVYLYATSTGGYGLSLTGGTTGDTLTIVNNGYIMGQGGNGGTSSGVPENGGSALNLGFGMSSCTINNTNGSAYIGGGGGGGSGGYTSSVGSGGGGGAGGGTGGNGNYGTGGAGGGIGSVGSDGGGSQNSSGGGGGGRIFPGTGGAGASSANATPARGGGAGGGGSGNPKGSVSGGNGGSSNNAGGNPPSNNAGCGSGGGGWGASGGTSYRTGGAGGKAVNTNGKSVTWTSGNTTRVWGSVS